MATTIKYKIEFYSDWMCSSGLIGHSDNLPIIDHNGFPFIPGKTLKGLIKEAAKYFCNFEKQNTWEVMMNCCFGVGESKQGSCYFSNATLSEKIQKHIEKEDQFRLLFRDISSTQLDEKGQAKNHSLRTMTVVAPLVLFAVIEDCPDEHVENMKRCLKWVKHIGSVRNRGFGRCKLEEIDNG